MRQFAGKIMRFFTRAVPIERHPWDFPELMLMEWIGERDRRQTIYIVGAHVGHEVARLLVTGAIGEIVLFEALPATADRLRVTMAVHGDRVRVVEGAVCDYDGTATFLENNLPGAGSILPAALMVQDSYGLEPAYQIEVTARTLDTFMAADGSRPDILWIDVQGAESKVLAGAAEALRSATLVFIEVSVWVPAYQGGAMMSELDRTLEAFGYRLLQLGTDPLNGTGNALYGKPETAGLASLTDAVVPPPTPDLS